MENTNLVNYVRSAAKMDSVDLSDKTDDELTRFALAYLASNIEDAVLSGLTKNPE